MDSLGVFSKPCDRHPSKHISDICTTTACEHRILCIECKKIHNHHHSTFFEPFLDFLSIPIDQETSAASEVSKECLQVIDNIAKEVDELFESIRRDFDAILEKIKIDLLGKIKSDQFFEPNDWDSLNKDLKDLKALCLDPPDSTVYERDFKLRQEYVDKCIVLKEKSAETTRFRNTVEKILNIQGADKSGLISKLTDLLIVFKKNLCTSPLTQENNNNSNQQQTQRSLSPNKVENYKLGGRRALEAVFTDRQHRLKRDSSVESHLNSNSLSGRQGQQQQQQQQQQNNAASQPLPSYQYQNLSPGTNTNIASWNRLFERADTRKENSQSVKSRESKQKLNKSQTQKNYDQYLVNNSQPKLPAQSKAGGATQKAIYQGSGSLQPSYFSAKNLKTTPK